MKFLLLLPLFLLAACAHKGFHQEQLRETLVGPPEVDRTEIAEELKKRPQLPKPFRLAVYFQDPSFQGLEGGLWSRWTEAQRDEFLAGLAKVPAGEIRSVFVLPGGGEPGIAGIRVEAARRHADAVLIISGAGEIVRRPNPLALGYILLAPMFFLHGTDYETLFLARATLLDVRNNYLYADAETESMKKGSGAMASDQDEQVMRETMREATGKLSAAIQQEINALYGKSELTAL